MNGEEIEQLRAISIKLSEIKMAAQILKENAGGLPGLECNINRILASIKMLEINFSDILEVL